jgi:hypothetical protein
VALSSGVVSLRSASGHGDASRGGDERGNSLGPISGVLDNPDSSKWVDGFANADRNRFVLIRASTSNDDIKNQPDYAKPDGVSEATTARETSIIPISRAT